MKIIILLFLLSMNLSAQSFDLKWSSYIGGTDHDETTAVKTDKEGNVYIVGYTKSYDYPTTPNAYQTIKRGDFDVFITKFDKNMSILWSTYLGGSGREILQNIELSDNSLWVVGETVSSNYPTTSNAVLKSFSGGSGDIVISKFSLDGELLFSTYFGGEGYDYAADITIDRNENVWITGRTNSGNFHTTGNAKKKNLSGAYDSFILNFSSKGNLIYSSLLGGEGVDFGLSIDYSKSLDQIVVSGFTDSKDFQTTKNSLQFVKKGGQDSYDGYICYFNLDAKLMWSSFYGGFGNDYPLNVKFDTFGNLYLNFYSTSLDLYTDGNSFQKNSSGKIDNYIVKLDVDKNITWSTYLGGTQIEGADNILHKFGKMEIDENNEVIIVGFTNSANFPVSQQAYSKNKKDDFDSFLTKFDKNGKLVYSTFLGGNAKDEGRGVFASNKNIFVVGWTESYGFPVTSDALNKVLLGERDGFLSIFGNDDVTCNEVYNSDNGFNNSVIKSNRKIDKSSFVRLTGTGEFDLGYMFHRNPINLVSGFETEFSFIISEGKEDLSQPLKDNQTMADSSLPGADGVVLIIAGAIPTTNGERGGGIGYAGFTNAVALEIDLFENSNYNDPNGNHFAIQIPGENGQLSARHNSETTLLMNDSIVEITSDSSQTYHCRVEYRNNTLTVFLDKTNNFKNPIAVLNNFDISKYLKMDMQSNGFLGLTSATGKSVEIHDITHWDICSYQKALLSSIEDKNESYGFYIYPNPTDDELHLQLPQGLANSVQVTLTDLLGRRVISKIISAGSSEVILNLNGLSKGLYNITISDDNETLYNSKVIKK